LRIDLQNLRQLAESKASTCALQATHKQIEALQFQTSAQFKAHSFKFAEAEETQQALNKLLFKVGADLKKQEAMLMKMPLDLGDRVRKC
jgi:hypothetical protein